MTISTTINRKEYTGNGVNDTFAYTFWISVDTDLNVYVDGVLQTITTDYTVTNADEPNGGNVVFEAGSIPADQTSVVLVRNFPITQETDYVGGSKFGAETHEKALDRLTVICQQLDETASISIRAASTVVDPGSLEITAEPAARANKYVYFDADGDVQLITQGTATGVWAATTDYIIGDIVTDGAAGGSTGDLYICKAVHTSAVWASESSNWQLMFDASVMLTASLLDEDDMASDSNTKAATQQSIKAYADLMLPLAGGTMTGNLTFRKENPVINFYDETWNSSKYYQIIHNDGYLYIGAWYDSGWTYPLCFNQGALHVAGSVIVKDQDDMSSDSATHLCTQQSIKAYADLMLPLAGGTLTGSLLYTPTGMVIASSTADGSDSKAINICGGGSYGVSRGSSLRLYGNEHSTAPGDLYMYLGASAAVGYTFGSGSGSVLMRLTEGGLLGLAETANANMSIGLTINQLTSDNEILALKSSDVAHGMTDYGEADTYFNVSKYHAIYGGPVLQGFTSQVIGIVLRGLAQVDDTTKSTAGTGPVLIDAYKQSGTGIGAQGADANAVVMRSGGLAKWILDEDGDIYQTGNLHIKEETHVARSFVLVESTVANSYPSISIKNDAQQYTIYCDGTQEDVLAIYDANNSRYIMSFYAQAGSSLVQITSTPSDGPNTKMTVGLTIDQGSTDDEILALKSSDVAHGVTDETETDTFGFMKKTSPGNAGLEITGISETYVGVQITGCSTTPGVDPTAANAAIILNAVEKSGTGYAAMTANSVLVSIQENSAARWAVDEDGDTWQAGSITAVNGNFSGNLDLPSGGSLMWDGSNFIYGNTAGTIAVNVGGNYVFYVKSSIGCLINDDTNTKMTMGLTINQGAADDEVLALKSSDVTHGVTDVTETDTFGFFQKPTASGGSMLVGISNVDYAVVIRGIATTDNTTKGPTGLGPVLIDCLKKSGTGTGDPGANANLVAIRKSTGAVWIVDEDGDVWMAGNLTIDPSNFISFDAGYPYLQGVNSDLIIGADSTTIFLGDSANAFMTQGITVQQAGNDDEIFALKSTDVSHGMTDYADDDTFGSMLKAHTTQGGVQLRGFSENVNGIILWSVHTTDQTTKSASGDASVRIMASKKSGTGVVAAGANANILALDNSSDIVWIADAEGDVWQSGQLTFSASDDSAAVADEVTLGGYEIGAGNRVLAISQETAVAADADETKFSNKLQVRINGATYYIMLTTT